MGVDFVAILGHSLDISSILSLPDRLNTDPNIGRATARFYQFLTQKELYPLLSPDDNWYWEESYNKKWEGANSEEIWDGEIPLQGPCTLRLHFGREALYLFAPGRFFTFVFDVETQIETRHICYALARALNGTEAIYLPDSGPWKVQQALDLISESYSLAQIQEWLRQNIGIPCQTIQDVDAVLRKDNALGGYYIDSFQDIRG